MNDLVAAVVFFGVGYWVGSRRPGSLGAEIPMGSNALRYDYFTEDDNRPLVAVEDVFGEKRIKLRKGCRYVKMFQCKMGVV